MEEPKEYLHKSKEHEKYERRKFIEDNIVHVYASLIRCSQQCYPEGNQAQLAWSAIIELYTNMQKELKQLEANEL